jgi:alpha-L-rhamnosidase
VEKHFLTTILHHNQEGNLPHGVFPMCYPADFTNENYIPNWDLWLILELERYLARTGDEKLIADFRPAVKNMFDFFAGYENEDGLLENVQGWNFIEWSKCNAREYISGINFPTNMLYYKTLKNMGEIYDDPALIEKANALKTKIIAQSFNGKFFEDNRLRDENGVAQLQNHVTETRQYYAFLTGVATRETFPDLYATIRDDFGPQRKAGAYEGVEKPNIIPGLLARETVLLNHGEFAQVLDEVKDIFFVMAEHYQTLWEMVDDGMSCNHGIASHSAYAIIRALTGFRGYENGAPAFDEAHANVDCDVQIQGEFAPVHVIVKDGQRTIC